jgi:hypothetical protein
MKRVVATLAVPLALAGCGSIFPGPHLITGRGMAEGSCFTSSASGPLVVDPMYGTAIVDMDQVATAPEGVSPPAPVPVAWRPGFTARPVGPEVEVLDPEGNVVAVTGHSYRISGGYVGPDSSGSWPGLKVGVFWACDSVSLNP